MELLIGILCVLPLLGSVIVVAAVPMEEWVGALIVCSCLLSLLIATPFMLRIEQTAGYYECKECGHQYVPKYKSVFGAVHIHTTRYMRCPKCRRWSWQKKLIEKD